MQLNFEDNEKNNDSLLDSNQSQDNYILSKDNNTDTSKEENQLVPRFTIVENNFSEENSDYKDGSVNISSTKEVKNQKTNNQNNNKQKDKTKINLLQFKIILVGDVAVGKTSIIERYINNTFEEKYNCTVQAEQQTKILKGDDNDLIKLNIWDTVGQEKFRSLTRQYYNDCQGAIIVFDLTKKKTFDYIFTWIEEIKNYGNEDTIIIILGNKSDLTEEREISLNEIKNKLNGDYIYFEVSAKDGNNISMAFDKVKKLILENKNTIDAKKNKKDKKENRLQSLSELDNDNNLNEKTKKCC